MIVERRQGFVRRLVLFDETPQQCATALDDRHSALSTALGIIAWSARIYARLPGRSTSTT